jgi:hypothetical protein
MDEVKLDALAGLVSEVDAAGPATPEQQAEQAVADTMDASAREWGVIAYTIGGALAMLAPELRQVYTEDACYTWGQSAAVVAQKYGWDSPGDVPEIGLLLATAGLAVPSYLAVSSRIKAIRLAQSKAASDAAKRDAADTVEAGGNGG